MAQKCVHKGCGKVFTDPEEPCVYHPGPPVFHEGQKGWKCCKPRVLTFDEFLEIPPCTTGKHSLVDDTPKEEKKPAPPPDQSIVSELPAAPRVALPTFTSTASQKPDIPAPPPETEDDDPSVEIPAGKTCRRRGCNVSYDPVKGREGEKCVFHPGQPIFHEGTKGWTCCKKRVFDFDDFLALEGCKTKDRHLFVGKGKISTGEEKLESVRSDFYQTTTTVYASLYLKKIDAEKSKIEFTSANTVDLDLHTSDNKSYKSVMELYGQVVPGKSSFKILGTKLELSLVKAEGTGWPVLKASDPTGGQIIQSGRAGRA